MAIVYIHRRKDIEDSFLNVFYIGIGRNESRAKTKKSRNFYWKNIVNKYGYDIANVFMCYFNIIKILSINMVMILK